MQILNNEYNQIRKIVETRAKYQKILLIHDEYVSETEISNIYQQVKGLCVFNRIQLGQDASEIYNGYKLLIFVMSANSFLKFNYDIEEFACVFIPQTEHILPFFLNNDCQRSEGERYLLISNPIADTNAISSLYFNSFFNYLNDLLCFQFASKHLDFSEKEISQVNIIKSIEQTDVELQFIDIKLAKEKSIDYEQIVILDFVLICAIMCVINAIGNKSVELVDFYKTCKEDLDCVDKYYAMQNNQSLIKVVELNFNFLFNACVKTKEKILSFIFNFANDNVLDIIDKVKQFSQHDKGLIGYLYLYNVFEY